MTPNLSLPQLKTKMEYCRGCHDNFYNHPEAAKPGEGISPTGMCWSLPSAKIVYRWSINMNTPMDSSKNFTRVKTLSCWHGEGPNRDIHMKRMPAHLGGAWADSTEKDE